MNVIDNQFLAVGEIFQVISQRSDILSQIFFSLLEGNKNARLVKSRCAVNKELNGEEGFTAASAAADERRPAFGQAPKVISSSPCIPVGVLGSDTPRSFPLFVALIMGDTFEELLRDFFTCDRVMEYEIIFGPVVRNLQKASSSISKLTT